MEAEESATPEMGMQPGRRPPNKKASLYAWTTLQSIPEETIISPHILEFLEQTLEPIPNLPSPGKHSDLTAGVFTYNYFWPFEQFKCTLLEKTHTVGCLILENKPPTNLMYVGT